MAWDRFEEAEPARKVKTGESSKNKGTGNKNSKTLDASTLESWLWGAACRIRGPIDAPKYKDYILPLIFLKRLSDVFEDEVMSLSEGFGGLEKALQYVEKDRKLVPFYLPKDARWPQIAAHSKAGLGEYLTSAFRAITRINPRLAGVIDVTDYNATQAGQRILSDDHIADLIQALNDPNYRLGIYDVEPDILGRAYEYLIRKFAEGGGQSAGEFYTPREVAILMARILDPEPGQTICDPCCGSGGLLIKAHLRLIEKYGVESNGRRTLPPDIAPLQLFGQEIQHSTFAMARMNAFIHDMEAQIALGDTMVNPQFTEADGSIRRFDIVTANPMWNQDFNGSVYENDPYKRFGRGIPPSSTADWGWIQHMYASLAENGKMAVVLDTGAVSRGSGTKGRNKERDIRRNFVEDDLVEAVFLLPENLFFNTSAPGIILVINRSKRKAGEILIVNASGHFSKGKPKNFLAEQHVTAIADAYLKWEPVDRLSSIITVDEAVKNDYNLSPSRYVSLGSGEEVLPLDVVIFRLRKSEEERAAADTELRSILSELGLE